MPDLFEIILRWWKQLLVFLILVLGITAAFVFSRHKLFLAVSTALPAPTYATDKAGVFSQNVQILYPGLGTADDLDMILGTAQLDTVYNSVAGELNLIDHYQIDPPVVNALRKAGGILKSRSRVIKSDYGSLKVKVWDGNASMAASMSNAIMQKLQAIHQDVQATNNSLMLEKIREDQAAKKLVFQQVNDSIAQVTDAGSREFLQARKASLIQQAQDYERLLNEYQLMVSAKPKSLVVIENAMPPLSPDKPRPRRTLLAAGLLAIFFGLLVALLLERRKLKLS